MQKDMNIVISKNILNKKPHQLKIDDDCGLGRNIYLNNDVIYSKSSSICAGNNVFTGRVTGFNIPEQQNSNVKVKEFFKTLIFLIKEFIGGKPTRQVIIGKRTF